ncbi:MAG: hypothetical protein N4A33_04035 [Bacteriovoracaceae bacterium]|jgi:hypothetical protein|nr:hypothetical protein [Bacteriovoracaceae bacterium]
MKRFAPYLEVFDFVKILNMTQDAKKTLVYVYDDQDRLVKKLADLLSRWCDFKVFKDIKSLDLFSSDFLLFNIENDKKVYEKTLKYLNKNKIQAKVVAYTGSLEIKKIKKIQSAKLCANYFINEPINLEILNHIFSIPLEDEVDQILKQHQAIDDISAKALFISEDLDSIFKEVVPTSYVSSLKDDSSVATVCTEEQLEQIPSLDQLEIREEVSLDTSGLPQINIEFDHNIQEENQMDESPDTEFTVQMEVAQVPILPSKEDLEYPILDGSKDTVSDFELQVEQEEAIEIGLNVEDIDIPTQEHDVEKLLEQPYEVEELKLDLSLDEVEPLELDDLNELEQSDISNDLVELDLEQVESLELEDLSEESFELDNFEDSDIEQVEPLELEDLSEEPFESDNFEDSDLKSLDLSIDTESLEKDILEDNDEDFEDYSLAEQGEASSIEEDIFDDDVSNSDDFVEAILKEQDNNLEAVLSHDDNVITTEDDMAIDNQEYTAQQDDTYEDKLAQIDAMMEQKSSIEEPVEEKVVSNTTAFNDIVSESEDKMIHLTQTIKILREERLRLEHRVSQLESDRMIEKEQEHLHKSELVEKSIELDVQKRRYEKKIHHIEEELEKHKYQLSLAEEKAKKLANEAKAIQTKQLIDVNKVRQREKDLEHQLEMLKKDTSIQLKNREEKILELKRRIDTLEFDMSCIQQNEQKVLSDKVGLEDKLDKVIGTLRSAIEQLEDDGSVSDKIALLAERLKSSS